MRLIEFRVSTPGTRFMRCRCTIIPPVLVFNSYIQHFLLPFITEVNFVDAVHWCLQGDVNQLTINAGYRESTHNTVFWF